MSTSTTVNNKTLDMVYIAFFAILIAVCSWICIPTTVPFTLQTFGVFVTVAVLGGRRGSLAVLIYLLLGAIGIPVFSGFTGGIGRMLDTSGGYIIGFLFSALFMWGMEKILGRKTWTLAISMILGLIICYIFGTAWFIMIYGKSIGKVGVVTALGWCVIPFIIPDIIKIILALVVSKRLLKIMKCYI